MKQLDLIVMIVASGLALILSSGAQAFAAELRQATFVVR